MRQTHLLYDIVDRIEGEWSINFSSNANYCIYIIPCLNHSLKVLETHGARSKEIVETLNHVKLIVESCISPHGSCCDNGRFILRTVARGTTALIGDLKTTGESTIQNYHN